MLSDYHTKHYGIPNLPIMSSILTNAGDQPPGCGVRANS